MTIRLLDILIVSIVWRCTNKKCGVAWHQQMGWCRQIKKLVAPVPSLEKCLSGALCTRPSKVYRKKNARHVCENSELSLQVWVLHLVVPWRLCYHSPKEISHTSHKQIPISIKMGLMDDKRTAVIMPKDIFLRTSCLIRGTWQPILNQLRKGIWLHTSGHL